MLTEDETASIDLLLASGDELVGLEKVLIDVFIESILQRQMKKFERAIGNNSG